MDAQQLADAQQKQLVIESDISAAVLGKGEEFVLVVLSGPGPIPEDVTADALRRGLKFCGVIAYDKMQARAAVRCEPDLEAIVTVMHAGFSFAQLVAAQLKAQEERWISSLWQLPG